MGLRIAKTSKHALYMDWSLSSKAASLRPPELITAVSAFNRQLQPCLLDTSSPQHQQARRPETALLQQLASRQSCTTASAATFMPEEKLAPGMGSWGGLLLSSPPGNSAVAVLPQAPRRAEAAREGAPLAAESQRPSKKARRGDADMQFFMKLQHAGQAGQAGPAGNPQTQAQQTGGSGMAEDNEGDDTASDHTAEALQAYAQHGQRTKVVITLPPVHSQVFGFLKEDEKRLMQGVHGIPAAVLRSQFPSTQAIHAALRDTEAQRAQHGANRQQLLKLYATAAVIRQTAEAIMHQGLRCAWLYFNHSRSELPGA
jgi:hypothetical protein